MSSDQEPAKVATEWSLPPGSVSIDIAKAETWVKERQAQARQRAEELRAQSVRIAGDLYQDGKPPAPFQTVLLGYADQPTNRPAVILTKDDLPAMAGRFRGATWYMPDQEGTPALLEEPIDQAAQEEMERLMRANILANAAQRPDVESWAIFDAEEHPDGTYTLRCWITDHTAIASMPVRQGTWAELFPTLAPPGALAQHPGPWRDGRAPMLSAMPFQIARIAMLATARTQEWATVDNVAVYRKDDTQHGQHVEVQRRCDAATPDAIFSELAAVAGDGVADTYAATVARIIDAGTPAEGIWINVTDVLHDRDLQPIRKRPGGPSAGYRTEDRLAVGEHFDELKRWHVTGKLTNWQPGKRGKKQPPMNIHSDFLTYTDMVTQTTMDGREIPVAVRVVLGEYARHFLTNGAGRQTAMLMRQALQYDPHNEQIEKRLAYHLAFYWRLAAHDRTYDQPMGLRGLFRDARIETDGPAARNPQRTIDRWTAALDTLKRDGVIAGYELLPGPDDAARGKMDRWLNQRIRFAPPSWTPAHYLDVGKSNPRLKAAH